MTASLGHGVPEITTAIDEQLSKVAFTYRTQFTNQPAEDLARRLTDLAPGDLDWAFFVSSGSEATEFAMRAALGYWREVGPAGQGQDPGPAHQLPRHDARGAVHVGPRRPAPRLWHAPARLPRRSACLSLPLRAPRRDRGRVRGALDRRVRGGGRRPGPDHGRGDHRRADRRRRRRRAGPSCRLSAAAARHVRPPGRAADPRRGHHRGRAYGRLVRLRGGGRGARPARDREGH